MSTQEYTIDNLDQMDDVVTGGDWDQYQPPSDFSRPPDTGEYTFMRAVEGEYAFRATRRLSKSNQPYVSFKIQAQIQGGPFNGRTVFLTFNTLTDEYKPVSSAAHFIKANRQTAQPRTLKEWEQAVEACIGPFNAVIRWEWYCKDCDATFLESQNQPKTPKNYTGGQTKVTKVEGKTAIEQTCPKDHFPVAAQVRLSKFIVPKATTGTATRTATNGVAPVLPPAAG